MKKIFFLIFAMSLVSCSNDVLDVLKGDALLDEFFSSETEQFNETLTFSGNEWIVRNTVDAAGPGPNYFSNSSNNVWVDEDGRLHLRITQKGDRWNCASVSLNKSLGYGKYIFYLSSRVDSLDKNVVFGLFTWDDDPSFNHREIDIEFAKWGSDANLNAQFVVQPFTKAENIKNFLISLNSDESNHSFSWKTDEVFFQSSQDNTISSWSYRGGDVPPIGNERVSINLWLTESKPPSDGNEVEAIIDRFEFVP